MNDRTDDSLTGPGVAIADASALEVSAVDAAACDPRLAEALESYRVERQAGRRVDRQALCARYPDLAATLVECLDALEFLQGAAEDLSQPATQVEQFVAPLSGEACLGDFQLRREIGRGGMGVVYEAVQLSLGRAVALKVLPSAAALDSKQLQRFKNEAQAAALLHHAHIVPVYAVGAERGVHYYAMQLIDGSNLATLIEAARPRTIADAGRAPHGNTVTTNGSAPTHADGIAAETRVDSAPAFADLRPRRPIEYFRTVARLGAQAAAALDHAHSVGVVHRDVKPANLLLDARGHLWVTDFGLARFGADAALTQTGDLVGTLRYMSPEQAGGRRPALGHLTDVYSLGATLYELLTLRPIFDGADRHTLLNRILHEEPRAPRAVDRAIPAELETILLKAVAKEPAERYATAQELGDDLERFLQDQPIRARRPTPLARVLRWARWHRPLVVSLGVSLALLLAGGAIGLLAYAQQQKQLADGWEKLAQDQGVQEIKIRRALFATRLGRAAALRRAREPGYRRQVWDDLREAVALEVPDLDLDLVRGEAVACLGDPIGLDPVAAPEAKRMPSQPLPTAFEQMLRDKFTRPPNSRAVSPDGRLLATHGGVARNVSVGIAQVVLWEDSGKPVGRAYSPLGQVYTLTFTPDGRALIAGCEEGVMRWSLPGTIASPLHIGSVRKLAVHPGGRLLATLGRHIELWSLTTNRLVATFPAPARAASVEFSADGAWLLVIEKDVAVVGWPVTHTPEKLLLEGHGRGVPAVAFSPDGKWLASASKDQTLRLWDAATGRQLHRCHAHGAPIEAVAFSPDGTIVATGDNLGRITLWNAATGAALGATGGDGKNPPQVWQLAFDASGKRLLAGTGSGLFAWTVQRAPHYANLDPLWQVRPAAHGGVVYDLAVHPMSDQVVFLDAAGTLRACQLGPQPETRPLGVTARVAMRGLHFDRAGGRLTYVSDQGRLDVWDWGASRPLPPGPPAFHLALAPSGGLAAASSPAQQVLIYDVTAGQTLLSLPAEGAEVWALAWSPDATRVAVGLSDGGVAIWNLDQVRASLKELGVALSTRRRDRPGRPANVLDLPMGALPC